MLVVYQPTKFQLPASSRNRVSYINFDFCVSTYGNTVEPLIKTTPDVRAPLYKGHFAESRIHSFSTNQLLR